MTMKFRVLQFNVQHFHPYKSEEWSTIDYSRFADAIRCLQPDLVTFNEVRGEGPNPAFQDQIGEIAKATGYPYLFSAPAIVVENGGPYGNAFLSKYPIRNCEIIPIPDPEDRVPGHHFESRAVGKVTVEIGKGVTVLFTHFGLNPSEAKNAAETVCREIRAAVLPVILTGDFNVQPENPVLNPIRALLKDTADHLNGEQLSFPSDQPNKKIDYVFASEELHVNFACIPPLVVSDHRPYVVDFEIEK